MALGQLPRPFLVDVNGSPRVGAKLYVYQSGTTTPITVYTTNSYTTAHDSPIRSLGSGLFPAFYVNEATYATYKVVVKDSADVELYSEDNIPATGITQENVGQALYPRTEAEQSVGVTPTNYAYPPGHVKRYNAIGDGATNDTAAFTKARSVTGGRYHLGENATYLVDASPDVWTDSFTAGGNVSLQISSTTYDVSNAIAGRLRLDPASNELTWLVDARTGDQIIGFQNNVAGRATYFNRGLYVKTDSHAMQMLPEDPDDSVDILMQRSPDHPTDASGNRFSFTYEGASDRWLFSYATSASGSPAFDTFMEVGPGPSAYMAFPGLQPQFQQGYSVKRRSSGGFAVECVADSTTVRWRNKDTPANINMVFADNAIGFLGASATTRPTVSGARDDTEEALASLLTALETLGLITDDTTAS